MSVREHRLEAILAIRDENFSNALNKAQKSLNDIEQNTKKADGATKGFIETMKGTAVGMVIAGGVAKGFDMIKASVDKAFNRIDTMDNFNRTMTLMTGNAKLVSSALNKIKTDVTGTAYGLDTASRAVQGLTSAGIDLGDSTKFISGWMDAVSTYGQGTDEQLQNVTYQLTQMVAKGKANLGDLKSAMEAGIPVVKIYAEATGKSVEEVSDAISGGAVNATEFMAVMDKAFREGTKSFKGIEGMAKKAGATWAGTFSNMKAAVTRGVQSIIEGFEKGAKAAEMPGIKDTVKKTGQEMEKGLKVVGEAANFAGKHLNTLLPIIVTGAEAWVAYHAATAGADKINKLRQVDGILSAVGKKTKDLTSINAIFSAGLSTAEGKQRLLAAAQKLNIELMTKSADGITSFTKLTEAQKLAILGETGAITAKSLALGVLNGQIKLSTALSIGLKAAWAANPIGLIAIGAVAGYKALSALKDGLEAINPAQKAIVDSAKEQAKSAQETIDAYEKLKGTYTGTSVAAESTVIKAKALREELNQIQNSTATAAEKQQRMTDAINELNQVVPGLNLEFDAMNGTLNKTTKEIDEQIESMAKLAKQNAMKEYLEELYKEQAKFSVEIIKTEQEMRKMEKAGLDVNEYMMEGAGIVRENTTEYQKLINKKQELAQKQGEVSETTRSFTEQLRGEKQSVTETKDEIDLLAKSNAEFIEKYKISKEQLAIISENDNKTAKQTMKMLQDLSNKYGVSMNEIAKDVIDNGMTLKQWGDEQQEVLKGSKKTFEEYIAATTNGFDTLQQKSSVSIDKFIANLKSNVKATQDWSSNMNTLAKLGVSQGLILELEKMGPAGAKFTSDWLAELKRLNNGNALELGNLNNTAKKKIAELSTIFDDGITAGAKAADESIKRANMGAKGTRAGTELVNGYKFTQPNIERVSREIVGGLEDNLKPVTRPKGEQAGNDLVSGLNSKLPAVGEASRGLGNAVNNNIKINTYSIGLYAGQGLVDGINKKVWDVRSAAWHLGQVAHTAMAASLEERSPSKKTTQIGIFAGEGLEIGMLGMEDRVKKASTLLGLSAVPEVPEIDFSSKFGSISVNGSINKEPAYINLNLGGNNFTAFVDNISSKQAKQTDLQLSYT